MHPKLAKRRNFPRRSTGKSARKNAVVDGYSLGFIPRRKAAGSRPGVHPQASEGSLAVSECDHRGMPRGLNNRRNLTSRHRLRGFDYRNPGFYFVTFCSHNRQHVFGEVVDGTLFHSQAGTMVVNAVAKVPDWFPNVLLDCSVVMPNHVHFLVYLPLDGSEATISDIVRKLKGKCVAEYRQGVMDLAWPKYEKHLWQQGFNDQIVRNDRHLDEVRRYIGENPTRWELDELYG